VPSALSQAVDFLASHANSSHLATLGKEEVEDGLGALFNALHNLKDINNIARKLLDELEREGPHGGYQRTHFMY
jgi:hypothetical protein